MATKKTMAMKKKASSMAMKKAAVMKMAMKKKLVGRQASQSLQRVLPRADFGSGASVYKNYDIDLNISDASRNMDKFYRMQVVPVKYCVVNACTLVSVIL